VTEANYDAIKNFAVEVVSKYRKAYYGTVGTNIGVIVFGNGYLTRTADGSTSISAAINVQDLTDDLELVKTKIQETTWQKGFTNMAQVFSEADVMIGRSRGDATSAVMVISDGKYTLRYQTQEEATKIKDKDVRVYMVPVSALDDDHQDILKGMASQPWEENYHHIESWDFLKDEPHNIAQKMITTFCPNSISPSLKTAEVNKHSYVKIKQGGRPQDWHSVDSTGWDGYCAYQQLDYVLDGYDVDKCAEKAKAYWPSTSMFALREAEYRAETYACGGYWTAGSWWWFTPEWVTSWCTTTHTEAKCRCYNPETEITKEIFEGYVLDPETIPECPGGKKWNENIYWTTYAINPAWQEI